MKIIFKPGLPSFNCVGLCFSPPLIRMLVVASNKLRSSVVCSLPPTPKGPHAFAAVIACANCLPIGSKLDSSDGVFLLGKTSSRSQTCSWKVSKDLQNRNPDEREGNPMDRRARKKSRFHEVLKKNYFPPPPPPSRPPPPELEPPDVTTLPENSPNLGGMDERSSSEEEDGTNEKKLTRSQRKRLRKRKLKEAASSALVQKRRLMGPTLPQDGDVTKSAEAD